jgi:hypothetical protein
VIGGGLSHAFRYFAPAMKGAHLARRFPARLPMPRITPSSFGPELGAYGAALMGMESHL